MAQTRQTDVFPLTLTSWIDNQLGEGQRGRQEVNRYVMGVYDWPLQVYFMGTRDRWLGEPVDVVQGFFASRLSREDFFKAWHESGLKLRQWLINAFCFYLKELRRAKQRDARGASPVEDAPGDDIGPAQAYHRAYIVSIVREALARTQEICEKEKLGAHWEVFLRHFYQGQSYAEMAPELGIDVARAAVMARTARTKFQATLRTMLKGGGAGNADAPAHGRGAAEVVVVRRGGEGKVAKTDDVDAEIRELLEGS